MSRSYDEIEYIWREFNTCVKRIQSHTEEARELLCKLSYDTASGDVDSTVNGDCSYTTEIPSSAGNEAGDTTSYLPSQTSSKSWKSIEPEEFNVDVNSTDVRTIWNSWKVGTPSMPSIEFMNEKYGYSSYVSGSENRSKLNSWRNVVEEIETHVDAGRDLEEVLVVAELFLEKVGGNIGVLSRTIMKNVEHNRHTLFELPPSSLGSM